MRRKTLILLALLASTTLFAQSKSFNGRVLMKDGGIAIEGAKITAKKGEKAKTVSDKLGFFIIDEIEEDFTLVIERKGFVTKSMRIDFDDKNVQTFELEVDPATDPQYDDILGYSDRERISNPNGELELSPDGFTIMSEDMVFAYMKRIPGISVINRQIYVRGPSSIQGTNVPTFVVDGMISTNGINDLDLTSIVKIEALKGSAASIYGGYSMTGVIVITTISGATRRLSN